MFGMPFSIKSFFLQKINEENFDNFACATAAACEHGL